MAWIFVAIGVFALAGAVFDWDWFMNHPKARVLARALGRGGARIFYGVVGTGFVVGGLLVALGVVEPLR
jgi:uncharacterized membrane protein YphA (DoxX/SURF4 family)